MPRVIHLVESLQRDCRQPRVFFGAVRRAQHHGLAAGRQPKRPMSPARTAAKRWRGWRPPGRRELSTRTRAGRARSTAHALKFSVFQDMYFENRFPAGYDNASRRARELMNRPSLIRPQDLAKVPAPGAPLAGEDFQRFVRRGRPNRSPPVSQLKYENEVWHEKNVRCLAPTSRWFSPGLRPAARPDRKTPDAQAADDASPERKQASAEATRNVGEAYLSGGNLIAALREFKKAEGHPVRFRVNYLTTTRRRDQAVEHQRAIQLKPDYAPAINTRKHLQRLWRVGQGHCDL